MTTLETKILAMLQDVNVTFTVMGSSYIFDDICITYMANDTLKVEIKTDPNKFVSISDATIIAAFQAIQTSTIEDEIEAKVDAAIASFTS